MTETPRREVMSKPAECTSEPITKTFLYITFLIYWSATDNAYISLNIVISYINAPTVLT
jgi:hypothetical protein